MAEVTSSMGGFVEVDDRGDGTYAVVFTPEVPCCWVVVMYQPLYHKAARVLFKQCSTFQLYLVVPHKPVLSATIFFRL